MKKRMIAGMMFLVLTVSGCSAVSTAPTTINELAEETRAEAETDSTDSILSSESEKADAPVESKAPEETESPQSTAAPEETASQPIAEEAPKAPEPAATVSSESKEPAAEATPAPTEQPQTAQQEPQETQPTTETPPPAPPQPTVAPEETKPKTAYDYEFDIAAIKADCIGIGQSMGLSMDSSLTPDNAAWWNPVTASQSNQGTALKQSLESYITFHTAANLGSYGMDEITDFNIYCEARGNGEYLIYFLFA
ncbi:hypothetical protein D3Z58_14550 [Clostridiaceae bacterium]|nr:hypothetical protein [Clostridiaceae bacterium]